MRENEASSWERFFSTTILMWMALSTPARADGGENLLAAGFLGLASMVILVIVVRFRDLMLADRLKRISVLISDLEKTEAGWSENHILKTVSDTFHEVVAARRRGSMDAAGSRLSPRMFARLEDELRKNRLQGWKNVLQDPELHQTKIVGILDRDGHLFDRIFLLVTFTLTDFLVDPDTGGVVLRSGERGADEVTRPRVRSEIWEFTRDETGQWVWNSASAKDGMWEILDLPRESDDRRYLALAER